MKRRRRSACASGSLFGDAWQNFESVSDFVAASEELAAAGFSAGAGLEEWAGGSFADVARLARDGDCGAVAEASRFADRINDSVAVAGSRDEWAPDVVGAFPSVPAFLAGDPCSMWARSPVRDERGEITVCVNISASVCVSTAEMRRRGVCVLAAVLALSRVRSVRLVVYASMARAPVSVRLSYPLDVSQVCAMVTSPGVLRQLFLAFGRKANPGRNIGWCRWSETMGGDERSEVCRELGGGGPVLVLTPHRLGSWAGLTDADFVNRINGMIEEVNAGGSGAL